MPTFCYKAIDSQGNPVEDTLVAKSREVAIDEISAKGLVPSEVKDSSHKDTKTIGVTGRVSKTEVETFTRELSNLLAAGVSLSKALQILSRETSKQAAKKQWTAIHDQVVSGTGLADSLAHWPKLFPSVYVAMVRAGETGGFLELVLEQIANFRSREQDLKSKVRSALIYPIVLAVLAAMILLFLLIYFIPRFSSIFSEFGGTLPGLTLGIVMVSQLVLRYWMLIAGLIVVVILGVKNFLAREEGRLAFERVVLKTPVIGKLTARFAFVRFARMLGTLVHAGVPLLSSLEVAKEAIGNETLARTVSGAIERVRRGMPLARSLSESRELFGGSIIEMISVAEESSKLDVELVRLAESYEKELDRNLKMAVSLAEPIMLFVMAALVGTVVIGMLLPIFNLQELIH
ncbi:MAG: type II secretion system F family protein [Sedimentisphaerales bacterium]|nr:type II secretion system F family protein [Sedimentisphaerales bacterium]